MLAIVLFEEMARKSAAIHGIDFSQHVDNGHD